LGDVKRTGRPPRFTPVQVAQVKALACRPAADSGLPLSRWSAPELARQVITDGICTRISASTVRRWLSQEALKPWQYQSWIFITDPNFAPKAQRVLDLYARQWQGQPLGPGDYVISADEKTSIQARCRCHPSLPPGSARMMRVNHDYHRRGAVAYLAAYDVHRAKVFGRCENTTGITPFEALVAQVMTQEPYQSAARVFWVVDNGSSHRGAKAVDRLKTQFPNAIMVHTPVHASWLNQVEIFFSIIQRKVLSPNEFTDTEIITRRLAEFETPLQPDRQSLQLEIHHHRPRRLSPTPGSSHHPPDRRMTTDELTNLTTDMEGGFVKWQGEAASTTVAADAASC